MAVIGHLRKSEWFGCPSWIASILLLHTQRRCPVISTSASRVKNWDADVSNWNNDGVLCWLCTGANETKEKRKIVESGTCTSGFSLCFCITKLNSLLHLYKCRIPLRISSVLIWIYLKTNSKSGNGRQTPSLTDYTYAKKLEELGIFGVEEK